MSELAVNCNSTESIENMLKLLVVNAADGTPYIDCDNKDDSWESILKRCIIVLPDGTYALQVYNV